MEITRTNEVITPEIATLYLIKNYKNRRPSKNRVLFYAREMREGRWQYNGDSIRFDSNGYLRDGQHRLAACVKTGIPIVCDVIRGLPPECFETVDQGKGRTVTDFFDMDDIPNSSCVSSIIQKFCKLKATGKAVISSVGGREKFMSVHELKDIYWKDADKYQDIVKMAAKCEAKRKIFGKSVIGGYIAYLHFTLSHEIDFIYPFFAMLHGLEKSRSSLCDKFVDMDYNAVKSGQPLSPQYKQTLLILCWNDYVKGCKAKSFPRKIDDNIFFL